MKRHLRFILLCSGVAALLLTVGTIRADDERVEKRVIRVVRDVAKPSTHWIGVHAIPVSGALRSHLQLEERLILAHVFPDSPAAKSGLKQHDIILKFGETEIKKLDDLFQAVAKAADKETNVTVLRAGKETKVAVTPGERPEGPIEHPVDFIEAWRPFQALVGDDNNWRSLRMVGPGFVIGRLGDSLPDGVTVNIRKKNDEPAKITVKRGGDEWEVTEETLDKLPEDLREPIKQHLKRHGDFTAGHVLRLHSDGAAGGGEIRLKLDEQNEQIRKAVEQFNRRFQERDPFKAIEEQIQSLRREIEKLREDREKDDDSTD